MSKANKDEPVIKVLQVMWAALDQSEDAVLQDQRENQAFQVDKADQAESAPVDDQVFLVKKVRTAFQARTAKRASRANQALGVKLVIQAMTV